jgi:hypothetical protein
MERRRRSLPILLAAAFLASAAMMPAYAGEAAAATPLRTDYYKYSCPNLESIVRAEVARKINQTVVTIPATLRQVFHDCMAGVSCRSTPPAPAGSPRPEFLIGYLGLWLLSTLLSPHSLFSCCFDDDDFVICFEMRNAYSRL